MMDMKKVESSQIHSIGHDAETATLAIRFRGNDGNPTSLYYYGHFTEDEFEKFLNADSIGSHFYKHIKPYDHMYPYKKIEDKPQRDSLRALTERQAWPFPTAAKK